MKRKFFIINKKADNLFNFKVYNKIIKFEYRDANNIYFCCNRKLEKIERIQI